jgi:putative MATE family efflux protein
VILSQKAQNIERKDFMQKDLTQGNMLHILWTFSLPYLVAAFLQTFYGLADLFIIGQYEGAAAITAVSVGSQVMHMVTVMIVGLSVGITVSISRSLGAGQRADASRYIGNGSVLFLIGSLAATAVLVLLTRPILGVLQTPVEAYEEAYRYLLTCFLGLPLIMAYNVIASILRGQGDSRSPMIFVAIAGLFNIGLDVLFIGPFHMSAFGAALATVLSQGLSVVIALFAIKRFHLSLPVSLADLRPDRAKLRNILQVGVPILCQEGFIQISFLVITVIVNMRGVVDAAAVGIGEKLITFLFLVPSSMMSSVSAIAAQNAGAGLHERSRQALRYAITAGVTYGLVVTLFFWAAAPKVMALFTTDTAIITKGSQYLYSYITDCMFASVHFCFSGFFSAYRKSLYAFAHNVISILTVRIPGAWFASVWFPDTLFPLGIAAPLGSLLSGVICYILYHRYFSRLFTRPAP